MAIVTKFKYSYLRRAGKRGVEPPPPSFFSLTLTEYSIPPYALVALFLMSYWGWQHGARKCGYLAAVGRPVQAINGSVCDLELQ